MLAAELQVVRIQRNYGPTEVSMSFSSNEYAYAKQFDGNLKAAGLSQPVQVLRDRYAVPHIVAQSFDDAAFALGYAHAQDRLWQMEMSRRFVHGRLAELLGERALPTDVFMRDQRDPGVRQRDQVVVHHFEMQAL